MKPPEAPIQSAIDRAGPGKLGSYALMGAVVSAVPLPIIPSSMVARVRGALLHEVASRHGLSLTPEARKALSTSKVAFAGRGVVGGAVEFLVLRVLSRLGPLTLLPPLQSALVTFAIGHLFERYVHTARNATAARVDEVEARRVRAAIDRALVLSLTTSAKLDRLERGAPEELRDQLTQVTDSALEVVASLPAWVVRRLESAFDAAIAEGAGEGPR